MAQTSDALVATRPAMKDLDWHNIWRAVRWPVYITLAILLIWYGPYFIAGYGWGYIGTGHASWSMANEGGIMPGSFTLHKAYPTYEVGDDVSFDYRGSKEPSENGKSIKRVIAINPGGTYRVEGLNYLNTIPPYDVPEKDIIGKIVWRHSFLPTSYWRWLSMGWALEQEEIAERYQMIFSAETAVGIFTAQGRLRNWEVISGDWESGNISEPMPGFTIWTGKKAKRHWNNQYLGYKTVTFSGHGWSLSYDSAAESIHYAGKPPKRAGIVVLMVDGKCQVYKNTRGYHFETVPDNNISKSPDP